MQNTEGYIRQKSLHMVTLKEKSQFWMLKSTNRAGENPQKAIFQQLLTNRELGSTSFCTLKVKSGTRLKKLDTWHHRKKAEESRWGHDNKVYSKTIFFTFIL